MDKRGMTDKQGHGELRCYKVDWIRVKTGSPRILNPKCLKWRMDIQTSFKCKWDETFFLIDIPYKFHLDYIIKHILTLIKQDAMRPNPFLCSPTCPRAKNSIQRVPPILTIYQAKTLVHGHPLPRAEVLTTATLPHNNHETINCCLFPEINSLRRWLMDFWSDLKWLTHWGLNKTADVRQTTKYNFIFFRINACFGRNLLEFDPNVLASLISHREWLGPGQTTSHLFLPEPMMAQCTYVHVSLGPYTLTHRCLNKPHCLWRSMYSSSFSCKRTAWFEWNFSIACFGTWMTIIVPWFS